MKEIIKIIADWEKEIMNDPIKGRWCWKAVESMDGKE